MKLGRKKKNSKKDDSIFVNVARTGSAVKEVALNGARTIQDALDAAGIQKKDSEEIKINGESVEDTDLELEDGDRVVLVKNVSGASN